MKINKMIMMNTIALDQHAIKKNKYNKSATSVMMNEFLDANADESSDDVQSDSDDDVDIQRKATLKLMVAPKK
jgi:hypothetical protein